MRRLTLFAALVLLAAGCAGTGGARSDRVSRGRAFLGGIEMDGPLEEISEAQAERLEDTSTRVLLAGPAMIEPILDEIVADKNQNRRLVLIKLIHLSLENLASEKDREIHYDDIRRAAKGLLASKDPLDRYTGALLTALPRHSMILPTAIDLLSDPHRDNRAFAIVVLSEVAGRDMGYHADAAPRARLVAVKRWRKWWREQKKREIYYKPPSNAILRGLRVEYNRISTTAGPYAITVTDSQGNPIKGTVVAYAYSFTTYDRMGKIFKERTTTDSQGKVLTAGHRVVTGMRFKGVQLIISKTGYKPVNLWVAPRFLTPNRFTIEVALEKN